MCAPAEVGRVWAVARTYKSAEYGGREGAKQQRYVTQVPRKLLCVIRCAGVCKKLFRRKGQAVVR